MKAWQVSLDRAGIGEILKSSEMANLVTEKATQVEAIAASRIPNRFRATHEVVTRPYTTDRQAAAVRILGPSASQISTKYAPLETAASATGLEIKATR